MHVCGFVCTNLFVCVVCVCACVRAYTARKVNPDSLDPMFSKHSIVILDTSETQDIFFASWGHWLRIDLLCPARRSVQV